MPSTPREWLTWYDRVGDSIRSAATVGETLDDVVTAAVAIVPGASWASVTRHTTSGFRTLASSGETASAADRAQYSLGQGPCVDAADEQGVFHSNDLGADPRWPAFAGAVRPLGIRGVLAVRMVTDPGDVNAALNLYAAETGSFDEDSQLLGTTLATHAGVLVAAAASGELAQNAQLALESNREIGVAMGVLMTQHRVTRDDAFTLLRIASQNTNRKLREIATEVADTGVLALPADRPRRPRGAAG